MEYQTVRNVAWLSRVLALHTSCTKPGIVAYTINRNSGFSARKIITNFKVIIRYIV